MFVLIVCLSGYIIVRVGVYMQKGDSSEDDERARRAQPKRKSNDSKSSRMTISTHWLSFQLIFSDELSLNMLSICRPTNYG